MASQSHELLMLEAFRDWMATLTVWQTWVGSTDPETLKARVLWPVAGDGDTMPFCILQLGASSRHNLTGAAGGSNWQPQGQLRFMIFDEDATPEDAKTGYEAFADQFYALIDQMADNAHEGEMFHTGIDIDPVPIVHSALTEDPDEAPWWQGLGTLTWGAASL